MPLTPGARLSSVSSSVPVASAAAQAAHRSPRTQFSRTLLRECFCVQALSQAPGPCSDVSPGVLPLAPRRFPPGARRCWTKAQGPSCLCFKTSGLSCWAGRFPGELQALELLFHPGPSHCSWRSSPGMPHFPQLLAVAAKIRFWSSRLGQPRGNSSSPQSWGDRGQLPTRETGTWAVR